MLARAAPLLVAATIFAPNAASATTVSIAFDPAHFSHPLAIDNPYSPLVAGTTFTYKAVTTDGCEVVKTAVTSNTRAIDGITTRVVHDVAYEGDTCGGTLRKVEDTFDWFAQDDSGNVWYMGENTSDCTATGCTPGEGSWEAGVDGAKPGIVMLAHPRSGESYRQEFSAGVAEDQALVTAVGVTVALRRHDAYPPGTFANCLVTKEWTDLEKGAIVQKSYCPGIGLVLTVEHHGKLIRSELTAETTSFGIRAVH